MSQKFLRNHLVLSFVIILSCPSGVGHGFKPSIHLEPGDEIELGIEGLGEQRQRGKSLVKSEGSLINSLFG